MFNCTLKDFLTKPAIERSDANWIDVLSTMSKQYNNRKHSPSKITPIKASLKTNEGFVYQILLDRRKKENPNIK